MNQPCAFHDQSMVQLLDALSAAETIPAVEAVDVSFTTPAGLESAKILFQS